MFLFPFLLNACQPSTDLPGTWTCGLNACLSFVFFFLLICFIQAFLVLFRRAKGGIFYFWQLCLSNCSHYSAPTMCIISHTSFKRNTLDPKSARSLTLVLKYVWLWKYIPVFAWNLNSNFCFALNESRIFKSHCFLYSLCQTFRGFV